MKRERVIAVVGWTIVAAYIQWATWNDPPGIRLLGILVLAVAVWRIYRLLTAPDSPAGERPVGPVAAKFRAQGGHRVVLQVTGPKPVAVIREIRRTTGRDLLGAKQLAEQAPVIVAENLSETAAAAVAERLGGAGARATAAPMDTHL